MDILEDSQEMIIICGSNNFPIFSPKRAPWKGPKGSPSVVQSRSDYVLLVLGFLSALLIEETLNNHVFFFKAKYPK